MKRIRIPGVPRWLWVSGLLCMANWQSPAAAGDQALIDFIGYSTDLRYFAFEEYGIQDGSGSAYSSVYLIDLQADAWVAGTPYRAASREDEKSLVETRHEARRAAMARIRDLKIDTPVQIAALSGDGTVGPATEMRFGFPSWGPPGATQGDYTLTLDTFDMSPTPACTETIGKPGMGYALSIKGQDVAREIHRDRSVPQSRGCPVGYRLYAVVFPYEDGEIVNAVAIVASYPFGFEGPDRRFLAVSIGMAQ
jgi:predicted secreted protein